MASIGHIAVGMAVARAYLPREASRGQLVTAMLGFSALSMLPDADVIGFKLGVAYEDTWGHRGATLSFVFALLVSIAMLGVARVLKLPPLKTAAFSLIAIGTHGLLDTLTNGGLGAELLWPFSTERFFAPVSPIPVAPIGLHMLSPRGVFVVAFELILFAPLFLYATFPRRRPA